MAETIFLSLEDLKSLFHRVYLENDGLDPEKWESAWREFRQGYAFQLRGRWESKFQAFFERVRGRK